MDETLRRLMCTNCDNDGFYCRKWCNNGDLYKPKRLKQRTDEMDVASWYPDVTYYAPKGRYGTVVSDAIVGEIKGLPAEYPQGVLRYCVNDVKTTLEVYETMKFMIRKVIFNNPATIVLWMDGTKTVVKAHDEEFDPEKGLAMAIAKKAMGNKGSYFNEFKKWIPKKDSDK